MKIWEGGESKMRFSLSQSTLRRLAVKLVLFLHPPIRLNQIIGTVNFYKYRARHDPQAIRRYQNIHKGETVYVMGSGPSLEKTKLTSLNNSPVVFCNGSFMKREEFKPSSSYLIITGRMMNDLRGVDRSLFAGSFRALGALGVRLKQGAVTSDDIVLRVPVHWGLFRVIDNGNVTFSDYVHSHIAQSGGGSVIFSGIQLASYMGASRIVLVGVDLGGSSLGNSHASGVVGGSGISDERRERMLRALTSYKSILKSRGILLVNGSPLTFDTVLPRVDL